MNHESIPGSDGRTTPLAARVVSVEPGVQRPGRRESGRVDAATIGSGAETGQKDPEARADMERLVEELNAGLGSLSQRLGFQVHEGTGHIVVQIVDRDSGEVIRESPPREFLDLAARMKEMVGLFLDEQG
jgi:flagellar protein FlaG